MASSELHDGGCWFSKSALERVSQSACLASAASLHLGLEWVVIECEHPYHNNNKSDAFDRPKTSLVRWLGEALTKTKPPKRWPVNDVQPIPSFSDRIGLRRTKNSACGV
ncbi:hypothetical protein Y032_0099g3211 [Ancylostoma ceylanicum]|uniref:Uncharacterized protein n=1 Tax=Ancylostoma ceylanicum TaxID=53326 RepID=A0A016TJ90_9BILA|nr:hypothetical protein Y032_0099g3211 [Ancylostoma ceylanicum]